MSTTSLPARRAIVKGAAWAVPAIAVTAAAPTYAASIQGLDGWLTRTNAECSRRGVTYQFKATPSGSSGGVQLGLWINAANPDTTVTDATLTFWIPSSINVTNVSLSNAAGWQLVDGPVGTESFTTNDGHTETYVKYAVIFNGSTNYDQNTARLYLQGAFTLTITGAGMSNCPALYSGVERSVHYKRRAGYPDEFRTYKRYLDGRGRLVFNNDSSANPQPASTDAA